MWQILDVCFCKYRLLKPCPHRACLHDKTAPRQSYVQFSGTLQQVHLRRLSGMSVLEERLRDFSVLLNGTERLRGFLEQQRLRLRELSLAPNIIWSKSCSQERLCCSWHTWTKIGKGWKYDDFDPWSLAPKWTECSSILVEVELGVGNPFPPYAGMKIKLTTKIFRAVDRGWRHMSRPISI